MEYNNNSTYVIIIKLVLAIMYEKFSAPLPPGMQDLSSLTRDQTHAPCSGSAGLNHWTSREVLGVEFFSHRRGPGGSGGAVNSCLREVTLGAAW